MFSGTQISLYPKTGDLSGVIINGFETPDHYRDRSRIEADDVSTLLGMEP